MGSFGWIASVREESVEMLLFGSFCRDASVMMLLFDDSIRRFLIGRCDRRPLLADLEELGSKISIGKFHLKGLGSRISV